MLASLLPPPFLNIYSLSTSSLVCNALYMVISFFVLWSMCLSSSLVHFKNSLEYLTRSTAQVFIPLIRFLLHSFVSNSFLVILRYSFSIFSFISACLMVSASKMPKYLYVSFSPSVLTLIWQFHSVRLVSFAVFHYYHSTFFYLLLLLLLLVQILFLLSKKWKTILFFIL